MRTVKKNVYYCDFCKKHSLRPLDGHEERCTANPNRKCNMHDEQYDLPKLIKKFSAQIKTETITGGDCSGIKIIKCPKLEDIQDSVESCPMCTLTILRCAGLCHFEFMEKLKFDFKKAVRDWWEAENDAQLQQELMDDNDCYLG